MEHVKSMKQYEGHEAFWGVLGGFEKISKIAVSERLFFLHNCSYPSYFRICEAARRVFSLFSLYFMKIMKIYEGGVFNGFFGFGSVFPAQDMKLEIGFASWKFINATPSAFPLRGGTRHLPHLGERQMGEDGIGGVL